MSPPEGENKPKRGMMAPDPQVADAPVSAKAFLWSVAGVLAVVELMLRTLSG